jgi:small-conductance mechanosensitive channel
MDETEVVEAATDQAVVGVAENTREVAWIVGHLDRMDLSNPYYRVSLSVAVILGSLFLALICRFFIRRRISKLENAPDDEIKPLRLQRQELFSVDDMRKFRILAWRCLGWLLYFNFGLAALTGLMMMSDFTQHLTSILLNPFFATVAYLWHSLLDYIPNLVTIILILFFVRLILRVIRAVFDGISARRISLPNFYPEWADTSFTLTKVLIYALTIVVIFPYLPGSDSPAFQGISIFLGVLFSLGSTSAVANVVAGVVLTYTRAFQVGDQVSISDTRGKVVEKSLFVTRIQTLKNVVVAIPNSMVLGDHIVNFTQNVGRSGLLVHTTITIGYDVPWKTVNVLLIDAANKTEGILPTPEPFVLQTSLDDNYVSYEINAWTREPETLPRVYSDLHSNILDEFHGHNVEITSPHYRANRDGNDITIPPVDDKDIGGEAPSVAEAGESGISRSGDSE